jgi:microcystin-dependent protein
MNGFNIRNQNQFSFSDLTANLKFIDTIELGHQPGKTNSGAHSIAIGTQTGLVNQGTYGIAIGYRSAQYNQSSNAIALGVNAGQNSQGSFSIAIGESSGQFEQKPFGISLGTNAGQTSQGTSAIAIGSNAGNLNQKVNSITIGILSGYKDQGLNAIAIGAAAGQNNQGVNCIAIGSNAGQTDQYSNSIILNASGNSLDANISGLFIKPIREDETSVDIDLLVYNNITSEITRQTLPYGYGDYKYSMNNVDHDHWLLCNGRLLNKNEYPLLFSMIGYSFGGSGNTFKLPDPRSRVLGAIGQGPGLSNRTIGQKVGSETHALTIDELPSHSHTITDPGHTHNYQYSESKSALIDVTTGSSSTLISIPTSNATTGITLGNTGGGMGYDIMQPTIFIGNVFIYADFK